MSNVRRLRTTMVRHSCEWLSCSGCGEEFGFPDAVFQYTDLESISSFAETEGHCWPVLDIPCWCVECNRPSFAERVPRLDEFMKAAAVQRIPEGIRKHEIEDELLHLEPQLLERLARTFLTRVSKPKCLLCGSQSFVPIQRWKSKTKLLHESCGSELVFHWVIQGSIGRREFRYFNPEGVLVWSAPGVA
jgi:hypothetical protein